MAKVSVIIPNYNHARFLKKRIDSVLEQTYRDFEVFILDDCSTDDSSNVIEQYRSNSKVAEIVYNESNSGSPFRQWQKGINVARGEFIWIAESDDFADRTFLEQMVEVFEKNENAGIAFCNSNWIDENDQTKESLSIYKESFFRKGSEEIAALLRRNTIQNASATLIRSALAKKYSGNIGNFKSCGDWLFYILILQESDLGYTSEILNNFRWYHSNTSNNARKTDSQLVEGARILTFLDPRNIVVSKRRLYSLAKLWSGRILNSPRLSVRQKLISLNDVFRFTSKFLFAR